MKNRFKELEGKKIIVTGGAGFIGSHIVEKLVAVGAIVEVVDDFSTGFIENLEMVKDRIVIHKGSITNLDFLRTIVKGAYAINHQAAIPSVPRSFADPIGTNAANVNGSLNIFYVAKESGVGRVVYASSSSVYGDTEVLPKSESMTTKPKSPYAAQKLFEEIYGRIFFEAFGLGTIGLRYFNVFGPRQNEKSQYSAVIPMFINNIRNGNSPNIHGDGSQTRDFTYVDNVVEANLLALVSRDCFGMQFNVGAGGQISINDLVKKICQITGIKIQPMYVGRRPGDVVHSYADITLSEKLLGYRPVVDFEDGLRLTIGSYR
ncbi:MAG: GDP-mannose 4,6-dehydratase [Patescibacteria group bacterium]|nr:GDP-mannose 4,6-dehydratase [Patescibacteria group bacterium]